jgi:hypothetical protein
MTKPVSRYRLGDKDDDDVRSNMIHSLCISALEQVHIYVRTVTATSHIFLRQEKESLEKLRHLRGMEIYEFEILYHGTGIRRETLFISILQPYIFSPESQSYFLPLLYHSSCRHSNCSRIFANEFCFHRG